MDAIPRLRAYGAALLGSVTDADDLVQETLLRAWKAQASFEAGTNQDAWMFRILRNAFLSQAPRRRKVVEDPDGRLAGNLSCEPSQVAHLELRDLQAAILRLPSQDREALLLVVAAGLSYEDAAAVCNCAVNAMKQRVWRARNRLLTLTGDPRAGRRDDSQTHRPSPTASLTGARPAMTPAKPRKTLPTAAERQDPADWIVRIATRSDRRAFAALFELFAPKLKSYFLRLGVPDGEAETHAQETLLMVWRKAASFDPQRTSAATWLFTLARDLRIDASLQEREAALPVAYPTAWPMVGGQAAKPEEGEQTLRDAIAALSPEQGDILRLTFFEERSRTDIARRLSLPLATVKLRIKLASTQLRASLGPLR